MLKPAARTGSLPLAPYDVHGDHSPRSTFPEKACELIASAFVAPGEVCKILELSPGDICEWLKSYQRLSSPSTNARVFAWLLRSSSSSLKVTDLLVPLAEWCVAIEDSAKAAFPSALVQMAKGISWTMDSSSWPQISSRQYYSLLRLWAACEIPTPALSTWAAYGTRILGILPMPDIGAKHDANPILSMIRQSLLSVPGPAIPELNQILHSCGLADRRVEKKVPPSDARISLARWIVSDPERLCHLEDVRSTTSTFFSLDSIPTVQRVVIHSTIADSLLLIQRRKAKYSPLIARFALETAMDMADHVCSKDTLTQFESMMNLCLTGVEQADTSEIQTWFKNGWLSRFLRLSSSSSSCIYTVKCGGSKKRKLAGIDSSSNRFHTKAQRA